MTPSSLLTAVERVSTLQQGSSCIDSVVVSLSCRAGLCLELITVRQPVCRTSVYSFQYFYPSVSSFFSPFRLSSVFLSTCSFVNTSVHPSVRPSVRPSIRSSARTSIRLFVGSYVCQSLRPSSTSSYSVRPVAPSVQSVRPVRLSSPSSWSVRPVRPPMPSVQLVRSHSLFMQKSIT